MKNLDVIWVLPHRDQSGDEDAVRNGRRAKLSAALAVEELPKELTIGVPKSVLRGRRGQEVLFAQYARQRTMGRAFFALSTTCGKDKGGRTVYLTLLEVLPGDALPELHPPLEGLPEPELSKAREMLQRLESSRDKWSRRVHSMLEAVRQPGEIDTFCSVALPDAAYPPQWTPEKKKPQGL